MANCIICNGTGGVVGKIRGTDLDCIFCGGTGSKGEVCPVGDDRSYHSKECLECEYSDCPPCRLDEEETPGDYELDHLYYGDA